MFMFLSCQGSMLYVRYSVQGLWCGLMSKVTDDVMTN